MEKLKEIKLTKNGKVMFTMNIDDWEYASDPICMALVTEEEWERIGRIMQGWTNDQEEINDDTDDAFWTEYEYFVNHIGSTFYYEDMTDEEYDKLQKLQGGKNKNAELDLLRQVYNRLKEEDNPISDSGNVSAKQIIETHNKQIEDIRHYFSRVCATHGAHSEATAFELDIDIEGTCGLSESEKIKYLSVFEQEGEGIIYFMVGGIYDEEPTWYEFDDMKHEELIYLVKELGEY